MFKNKCYSSHDATLLVGVRGHVEARAAMTRESAPCHWCRALIIIYTVYSSNQDPGPDGETEPEKPHTSTQAYFPQGVFMDHAM